MRSLLRTIVLIGYITTAFGQNKKADSLRIVLTRHPQADTFRVNRLNELAAVFVSNQFPYDSVANEALQLARKLNYLYGEVNALLVLSAHAGNGEEIPASQQYVGKALQLAQKIGTKKLLLAAYKNWIMAYATPVYQKQIADTLARSRMLARQLGDYNSLVDIDKHTTKFIFIQSMDH